MNVSRKQKNTLPHREEIERKEREKMANRKRSKQLKIYLSDEEYQTFIEQVEKSKLSQIFCKVHYKEKDNCC